MKGAVRLGAWALAALSGGCYPLWYAIPPAPIEQVRSCGQLPVACRNHVHIFFLQGLDPIDRADLAGLRDYVQSLGFIKTWYGYPHHARRFAQEAARLHAEDATTRFVVIGQGGGVEAARNLAATITAGGVPVDLLVYLGATPKAWDQPLAATRIVNVRAKADGVAVNGALNVLYDDATDAGVVAHPYTRETLLLVLCEVAGQVPVELPTMPPPPLEEGPAPRPAMSHADGPHDEWDFLKPRSPYEAPRAETPAPAPKPAEPPPVDRVGRR